MMVNIMMMMMIGIEKDWYNFIETKEREIEKCQHQHIHSNQSKKKMKWIMFERYVMIYFS